MATFAELQTQVLEACGHTSAASSAPRTRIRRSLNNWQRRILTRPGYSRLLADSEVTFASVANQHTYGLGLPMGRLLGIHERSNDRPLSGPMDIGWLRRTDPGLDASGSPVYYVSRGWFPVQAHPANASSVFAKSTAAGDTTQIVDWEVVTSALQRISGSTTLTGTTAVQLGTFSTAVEVTKLSLRTAPAGVVTVHEDSGTGSTLLTLPIGQSFGRFLHIQLWPTPSAVVTYYVDYTRELADMTQDTDIPLLPPNFHHLLGLGAEYDEWRQRSDDRATLVYQDLQKELANLNAWVWDLPDATMGLTGARSRLGAHFPAGT